MNEAGFEQFLKKAGKKPHVIDGLVRQVLAAEAYFQEQQQASLADVTAQQIRNYGEILSHKERKARMRGLSLYFSFSGQAALAKAASDIREAGIAKTRRGFKLRSFRGVQVDAVKKLESLGIVTVADLLAAGKTPQARKHLAEEAAVSSDILLELVKLSDLSRLGAVKSVRARLYYDAGLDTPDKFTEWEPEALRQMLVKFVEATNFDGIAPLPKELRNAIAKAHKLPRIISY